LPFYILVPVLAYALWYGLQPATMIAPFHLPPEDKAHPLPFSGEAVADAVQDAITSIRQEAAGHPLTPPCDFLAPREKEEDFGGLKAAGSSLFELKAAGSSSFEARGPVLVEVKGISPEAVVSAAREVLGKEGYITGDVVLGKVPNSFQLMARAKDGGPWMTKPKEISLDGLMYASCELAERILGATNKNVLAAAWIRRGKYDNVVNLYGDLPSKGSDPDALNNLGTALREKGKGDEAVARFRQALAGRWWSFPEAQYNLGVAFYENKQTDEAIAEFRKVIELEPDAADAHNNLGAALGDAKRYDEAMVEFRKVIELKPDDVDARSNLGIALGNSKRYDEAIVEFRKVIELKPDDADAHNNLGVALGYKGDNDAGIAEYRKAIDGYLKILAPKPDDAEARTDLARAHNNLGVALLDKGQTDEAIAEFRKALELKPDYQTARDNLAGALARKAH
jgi:tetratricopeptide (TPR) repeat protein